MISFIQLWRYFSQFEDPFHSFLDFPLFNQCFPKQIRWSQGYKNITFWSWSMFRENRNDINLESVKTLEHSLMIVVLFKPNFFSTSDDIGFELSLHKGMHHKNCTKFRNMDSLNIRKSTSAKKRLSKALNVTPHVGVSCMSRTLLTYLNFYIKKTPVNNIYFE